MKYLLDVNDERNQNLQIHTISVFKFLYRFPYSRIFRIYEDIKSLSRSLGNNIF